jgi:hypothetical protein
MSDDVKCSKSWCGQRREYSEPEDLCAYHWARWVAESSAAAGEGTAADMDRVTASAIAVFVEAVRNETREEERASIAAIVAEARMSEPLLVALERIATRAYNAGMQAVSATDDQDPTARALREIGREGGGVGVLVKAAFAGGDLTGWSAMRTYRYMALVLAQHGVAQERMLIEQTMLRPPPDIVVHDAEGTMRARFVNPDKEKPRG